MTLAEIYQILCDELRHLDSPSTEAWEMLYHATPWKPKDLIIRPHVIIESESLACLEQSLKLRQQGNPLAYILGRKHFWKSDFTVNPSVLIPRSETECLIEWLLANFAPHTQKMALDLGTGSGAIAISLALERPNWQIIATDQSEQALAVAKNNALILGANNIKFYLGDWFSALPQDFKQSFDIIISNPPYISAEDPHLQLGDLCFEPKSALIAVDQGFDALKRLADQSPVFLQEAGVLMLEHGYEQQSELIAYLQAKSYQNTQGHNDYQSNPRFVTAIRPMTI